MRSASQSRRGELGPPTNRCNSRETQCPWVARQCVCVAQVGQVALDASRAVRPPGCVLSDVAVELRLSSGHIGVPRVVVFGPETVAKAGSAAACYRTVENPVSDAGSTSLCVDDSAETLFEGGLHLLNAEVKTVPRHRKNEGGRGRWLETGGVRVGSCVSLRGPAFLGVCGGRSLGDRKRREPSILTGRRAGGCSGR